MASKYNMTIEEFSNFSNVAYEALSEPKPRWTYTDSIDFVFQAVTTIGYGYITPQTPAGQILCIVVSLFGIPITLLALKSIGELIAKGINKIVTNFEKKILKRSKPKYVKPKSVVILSSLMVLLIVVNVLAITRQLTDWTIIEGVFYWFITFTTIGFGDYVLRPPQRIRQFSVTMSSNKTVNQQNKPASDAALAGIHLFFIFYYLLSNSERPEPASERDTSPTQRE
ncbi:hypothetical protein ACROYT_G006346 [Oculina patagonica]